MTRKDYERIAQAIHDARADAKAAAEPYLSETDLAIDAVAERIADQLAADNPNFDAERFLAACS